MEFGFDVVKEILILELVEGVKIMKLLMLAT